MLPPLPPLRPICQEIPGHPLHVIQRGRLRTPCFFGDEDCAAYLGWLGRCAASVGCAVHAYVLMGNHVHLLLTPSRAGGVANLMRSLGEQHARYLDTYHHRDGALWEDRYEAFPVHIGRYLLSCMRYIELNPVRASVVAWPGQYPWSSFHANALGHNDAVLTPHAHYCALGRSAELRQTAYRALFQKQYPTATGRRPKVRVPARGN
jgi:putative transposase